MSMQMIKPDELATHLERKARDCVMFGQLNEAKDYATAAHVLRNATWLPTIKAEPVRHGRWEWDEDWGPSTWLEPPDLNKAGWKCSNCGIDLGDYLTDCLGVNVYVDEEDKMPKIKRCPNCGAKMDGMRRV